MRHHFSWLLLVIGVSALITGCPRDGPPLEITATVTLPDREVEIPITTPRQRLVYGNAEKIGFSAELSEENTDEFTSTVSIRYDESESWQEMIVLEPTGDNMVYFEIDLNLIEDPYFWLRFEAVHKDWIGLVEWTVEQDLLCSPASIMEPGSPGEWISFEVQPRNARVNVGGTAEFEVMVAGSGMIQYQWQDGNGIDMVGEISNILTIPNVKQTDSGKQFRCFVTCDDKSLLKALEAMALNQKQGAKPEGETPEGADTTEGIVQ